VVVYLAAANRDESVYTDPDRLDLARREAPNIGFGYGPHHCLGAALARMELRVALETLLTRLPGLRFAESEQDVVWKSGTGVHGPRCLPVRW
jgi:cytochrome P450